MIRRMAVQKRTRRRPLWFKIVVGLCVLILVLVGSSLAIITFWPDVAAKNIDRLRDVIGDAPVAQLEAVTLSIQDRVQQLQYQAGLAQPSVPWAVASPQAATPQPTVAQPTATPHTLHNCDGQLEDQASSAQPTIQRTPQFQDQASSAQPTNQRTPPLPTSATQQ